MEPLAGDIGQRAESVLLSGVGHYAIELTSVTKHFGDKQALQGRV